MGESLANPAADAEPNRYTMFLKSPLNFSKTLNHQVSLSALKIILVP